MNPLLLFAALIALLSLPSANADQPAPAYADGVTDATGPIQSLLDDAGKAGGEVRLPPGQYLLRRSLNVPPGVTLCGSWDEPHHGSGWNQGTTLLVTGGRGQESAQEKRCERAALDAARIGSWINASSLPSGEDISGFILGSSLMSNRRQWMIWKLAKALQPIP